MRKMTKTKSIMGCHHHTGTVILVFFSSIFMLTMVENVESFSQSPTSSGIPSNTGSSCLSTTMMLPPPPHRKDSAVHRIMMKQRIESDEDFSFSISNNNNNNKNNKNNRLGRRRKRRRKKEEEDWMELKREWKVKYPEILLFCRKDFHNNDNNSNDNLDQLVEYQKNPKYEFELSNKQQILILKYYCSNSKHVEYYYQSFLQYLPSN